MFRIAKNLVKSFEQSVQEISQDKSLDTYFQSLPPNLLVPGNNSNTNLHGLRIVQVDETQLQLESFFDFIVGINDMPLPFIEIQNRTLYPNYNEIFQILNDHCGSSVKFNIWSGKGGQYRDEYMNISAKYVMEDVPLNENSSTQIRGIFHSLGFKVQWTPLISSTYVYHVLQINFKDSPAYEAGLIPSEDYIISCQDGLLATGGEELLQDIIKSRVNSELIMYVYNAVEDCVRPVTVNIGNNGRLGCGVGYGFLHRIPPVKNTSTTNPPEPFSSDNHFIPGAGNLPTGFTPISELPPTDKFISPFPSHRKKKHVHHTTEDMNISDYFQEGKDQSPNILNSYIPPPPVNK